MKNDIQIKKAETAEEITWAKNLVEQNYVFVYGFSYYKILDGFFEEFPSEIFIVFKEEQRLGTFSLTSKNKEGKFPSELLFDFNIETTLKNVSRNEIYEVGRVARDLTQKDGRSFMLNFELAVLRYGLHGNFRYWTATMHSDLKLSLLQEMPVGTIQKGVNPSSGFSKEIVEELGNYVYPENDVNFVYCSVDEMRKSFEKHL